MATRRAAYLDSSALAKLVVVESETRRLIRFLRGRRVTTSELAIVELARVERLSSPRRPTGTRAREILAEIYLISLSRDLLERAAELTAERVRSLDAIHIASALAVEPDELVAYDRRLLDAARAHGLVVASPA